MAVNNPETACLETESILTEILDMIQCRASVVDIQGTSLRDLGQPFPHNATVIDKIQWLRDMIWTLAPKFVDMDYPYFDKTWTEFPKFFSANQIKDDQEHGINVLPAKGSSFDNYSIEVYRTALANMIYWLKKFRYVASNKSFYDKTFKRKWYWRKSFNSTNWNYEYRSTENEVSGNEPSMEGLAGRMDGVEDEPGPPSSFIFNSGHRVFARYVDSREKGYQYKDSYSDPKPMTKCEDIAHEFELSNVPHILTTRNPTCFAPTLYWYIIPNEDQYSELIRNVTNEEVTEKEPWRDFTWGENDEYSATEYVAKVGTGRSTQTTEVSFRNQFKETYSKVIEGLQDTQTDTTYSSDGQRSFTKTKIKELTSPHSVSVQDYKIDEWKVPTFGLVTMNSNPGPRYEAGIIAPYSSLSWTVCSQNSLIDPGIPQPTAIYAGMEACYSINQMARLRFICSSRWVPILDFGDFSTEVPEQNP